MKVGKGAARFRPLLPEGGKNLALVAEMGLPVHVGLSGHDIA
jgi:hypothetical protein